MLNRGCCLSRVEEQTDALRVLDQLSLFLRDALVLFERIDGPVRCGVRHGGVVARPDVLSARRKSGQLSK